MLLDSGEARKYYEVGFLSEHWINISDFRLNFTFNICVK